VKLFSPSERIQALAHAVSLVALGYGLRADLRVVFLEKSQSGSAIALPPLPVRLSLCRFGRS
jgi:hypothetical protein